MLLMLAGLAAPRTGHAADRCRLGMAGATRALPVGDTGRSMEVHMPATGAAQPRPLVFVLHGSGSSGEGVLRDSGLAALSDSENFILAAPDGAIPLGKGYAWNIPGVPTVDGKLPGKDDADDVAYIGAAIDWMVAKGCADPDRVYVTGISGGGRMTSWLGCVAADRFAAIAPVVGLRAGNPLKSDPARPDPATCRPARPLPVLAFAGDADTVNPVDGGGAGYWQYSMDTALTRWAALDGCKAGPQRIDFTGKVLTIRYDDCSGNASVSGWIYHGRGHEWVADNAAMWRFFERHRSKS
ncbi:prolyl oligopeptidase family serine peptidase [Stakelama sp. CBK3Z-3]|uniref:Prolyl oligopeptidase family serine peptidase n=2 Tax=Stakelama flava TaxID=2860338 RepID=A0ABS6XKE6_9SPHN|nr:prolyl oligopeptidase family serine peptidase [Stakelama flava]